MKISVRITFIRKVRGSSSGEVKGNGRKENMIRYNQIVYVVQGEDRKKFSRYTQRLSLAFSW